MTMAGFVGIGVHDYDKLPKLDYAAADIHPATALFEEGFERSFSKRPGRAHCQHAATGSARVDGARRL